MSNLDSLVSAYEQEPVQPRSDATPLPQKGFVASAHAMAIKANETLPAPKRIHADTVDELLNRISELSEGSRLRALTQYINTIENPDTNNPTEHRDLLPRNHPLSTQWVSSFQVRKETAEYFQTHPKIEDAEVRALVASAVAVEPETAARKFFTEAIIAKTSDLDTIALIQNADIVINNKTSQN